ncbi:ferredoxin [Gloeomargarita lithophora Alchichica-D10]|uniref:Ferredoxin n=1 Tax=Gloeomargarita lithophora Alchichica-D10 TaxID=1188229 RepID=A0A1J0ACT3_9CYAN|nr:2Fe-2S iron-sulfur cluster-binding protein [Gloeomargarita lithophora]APB33746.1 ferredoxin [Gloeomargarita lithophora Alchichica-D10]
MYQVHLFNPEQGTRQVIDCAADETILDAAENAGLDLPYSCRAGVCGTCATKLTAGVAPDQSDQSFLDERQIARGLVLICSAYATGDCTLTTHQRV